MPLLRRITKLPASLLLPLLIALIYVPILGGRPLRTAGDEKVYVSQALEMARDGRWFVQTLQDVPDYYKGPVHYVLVRIGLLVFGLSPWAAVYMNPLLCALGALALAAVVRRRLPGWVGGDLWTGLFFATCVGVYSHA